MGEKILVQVEVQGDALNTTKVVNDFDDISKSSDKTSKSIKDSGGAMATLNTLTGGVAGQIKDGYDAILDLNIGTKLATVSAKLFGTTMKAAIASTGIGLLLVAVVLLVEYWDDITDFVGITNTRLEEQVKLTKSIADNSEVMRDNFLALKDVIQDATGLSELDFLNQQLELTQKASFDRRLALKNEYNLANGKLSIQQTDDDLKIIEDFGTKTRQILVDEAVEVNQIRRAIKEEEDRIAAEAVEAAAEARKKVERSKVEGIKTTSEQVRQIAQDEYDFTKGLRDKNLSDTERTNALLKRFAQDSADFEKARQDEKIRYTIEAANVIISSLSMLDSENRALQAGLVIADAAVSIAKIIIATQGANAVIFAEGAALAIPSFGASVVAAASLITANNVSAGISIAGVSIGAGIALSKLGKGGAAPTASAPTTPTTGTTGTEGIVDDTPPPPVGVNGNNTSNLGNDIANALGDGVFKTFVVSSDVTNAQELDRATEAQAQWGS